MNIISDAVRAILILKACKPKEFGSTFVQLRMEFWRAHANNLVFSTSHGADFFDNVLECTLGKKFDEGGEYGDNFKKMIERSRQQLLID